LPQEIYVICYDAEGHLIR